MKTTRTTTTATTPTQMYDNDEDDYDDNYDNDEDDYDDNYDNDEGDYGYIGRRRRRRRKRRRTTTTSKKNKNIQEEEKKEGRIYHVKIHNSWDMDGYGSFPIFYLEVKTDNSCLLPQKYLVLSQYTTTGHINNKVPDIYY